MRNVRVLPKALKLRGFFADRSDVLVASAVNVLAGTMGRVRAVRDTSGIAAVEFALLVPVLLAMLVGMFVFGVALNNYVTLTNAAQAGALQFAISRGDSTGKPYSDTISAISKAAPSLAQATLTITLKVNGTACTSDSTCQAALSTNAGQPASVTASYPCIPGNPNLTVMAVSYAQSCTMTVNTTERIQ